MAEKINMKTLLINVKRRVWASGKSLADFEKNIGVSAGYLSRIAKGKGSPSFELIVNIADELGVSVDTLIEETRVEKNGLGLFMSDSALWKMYKEYRRNHILEEFEWMLRFFPLNEEQRQFIEQNKAEIALKYEDGAWNSYSPIFTLDNAIKEAINANE